MRSVTHLEKEDVATGATDMVEEAGVANMNARAEAAGEVAVADTVATEAKETTLKAMVPSLEPYRQLLQTTRKLSTKC